MLCNFNDSLDRFIILYHKDNFWVQYFSPGSTEQRTLF
jgi:hypothetical protein